jgi:hypothetical protein
VEAQIAPASAASPNSDAIRGFSERLYPSLYFTETLNSYRAENAIKPYWVEAETEVLPRAQSNVDNTSILLNNDVLAFYGHPLSKQMGILGRYSIEDLDAKLSALAEEYSAVSGGRGVQKAF